MAEKGIAGLVFPERRRRKRETTKAPIVDDENYITVKQKDGFVYHVRKSPVKPAPVVVVNKENEAPLPLNEPITQPTPVKQRPEAEAENEADKKQNEPIDEAEIKRRRVHRKLKLPEYPAEAVNEAISANPAPVKHWRNEPEEAMVTLMHSIMDAEESVVAECFTEHFSFVSDAIMDVCGQFKKQMNNPSFKPRQKLRNRIENEKEKLLHNEDNKNLRVRQAKLERAVSKLQAEEAQWKEVDAKIDSVLKSHEEVMKVSAPAELMDVAEDVRASLKHPTIIKDLHQKAHEVALAATQLSREVNETVTKTKMLNHQQRLPVITAQKPMMDLRDFELDKTRDLAFELLNSPEEYEDHMHL